MNMNINIIAASAVAFVVSLVSSQAFAADGPMPIRAIAPDTTYVIVSADQLMQTVERWQKTPIQAFLKTAPMAKVLGTDGGAQDAMEDRLKELGIPEGTVDWPTMGGMTLFTVHDEELDVEQSHALVYGDWGAKADGMAKLFDAVIAESVKKDGVTVEKEDIAGREVQVLNMQKSAAKRNGRGGAMGIEMDLSFAKNAEKVYYCRDGSRFLASTDAGGMEDALLALDGKRKAKLPEQSDFRGAMDQLGETDISVVILTGPLQKSIAGEGAGMLAMVQPVLQPLVGDVQAWTIGIGIDTPRGQIEVTSGIYVPGDRVGLWALLGPSAPIEAPPPMIGPDAVAFGRVNVQLKNFMNLINTVVANLPEEQAQEIDGFLVNFGPVMSKGFEALGPSIWTYETIRQPVTPESRVTGTIVTCTNPKAVVPMITQFGGTMGLEPRDFDGNTIFSADFLPMSIGVANGFMATGDSKLVEQAMRSMGQKDLPSVADNQAYKAAALAVGGEAVISWGYIDLPARWGFERELLEQYGEDDSKLDNAVSKADDSSVAKRLGFKVPGNSNDVLKTMDAAMVAKYFGSFVWSMKSDSKGFVTRAAVMQPAK
ncbi:MAG: hypothetical protein RIR77_1418 [Planctomycetota bacterium]